MQYLGPPGSVLYMRKHKKAIIIKPFGPGKLAAIHENGQAQTIYMSEI